METYALRNRRRAERVALQLPVRVEVKESQVVSWDEISRFVGVSHCGAGVQLKRPVEVGQLLCLTAPLPQKLRCYDYSEPQYKIWGVVRHCNLTDTNQYHAGIAFVGKNAPASFHQNPSKRYDLTRFTNDGLSELTECRGEEVQVEAEPQPMSERRKAHRYQIPMEVFLESLNNQSLPTSYETTVTENVSLNGASLLTSLDSQTGDLVRVSFMTFNISIVAKVCHRRVGMDGITRLNLEFIDRALPLEGIG